MPQPPSKKEQIRKNARFQWPGYGRAGYPKPKKKNALYRRADRIITTSPPKPQPTRGVATAWWARTAPANRPPRVNKDLRPISDFIEQIRKNPRFKEHIEAGRVEKTPRPPKGSDTPRTVRGPVDTPGPLRSAGRPSKGSGALRVLGIAGRGAARALGPIGAIATGWEVANALGGPPGKNVPRSFIRARQMGYKGLPPVPAKYLEKSKRAKPQPTGARSSRADLVARVKKEFPGTAKAPKVNRAKKTN